MPTIRRLVLALPEHEVTLDEILEHLEREYAHSPNLDRAPRAVRACGVKTRRYCLPLSDMAKLPLGECLRWHFTDVCDLSVAAARQSLAEAGLAPTDVGTLITATTAGYRIPSLDGALVDRLELLPTVRRMPATSLGCGAAPYALFHAVEHARRHTDKAVLVVCADMFVPFQRPDDIELDAMIFRGLMADGAAACVVDNASAYGPSIIDSCSYNRTWDDTRPGTADIVGYQLDDDFHLSNSTRLLTTIQTLVPPLAAWLDEPPRFVIPHPGGPHLLRMLAAWLPGGPALLGKAHQSLAELGNMGSPSAMDVLARTFDDPPPPGSRGVLIGLGPGVTMVACLTEWH